MKTETIIAKEKLEIFVNQWAKDRFGVVKRDPNYRVSFRKLDDVATTATLLLDDHGYRDEEVISSYLFRDGKITDLTKSRRSKTKVIGTYTV